MLSESEIKDLKEYLVNTFHSNRLSEQQIDDEYYRDVFEPALIKNKAYKVRTGSARDMVDDLAGHIVTSNPQVFRQPKKNKAVHIEAASRVASELNRWKGKMLRQTPQPFHEHPTTILKRGEGWIYVVHNDTLDIDWQEKTPEAMPVRFILYDPMVVFFDPAKKGEDGVPGRVIVSYERSVGSIMRSNPQWKPGESMNISDMVPYFMFYDNESRYIEAGSKDNFYPISDGIEENIYGIVPFVHCYSGLGSGSADGDPANLAVSRIRNKRSLLEQECIVESDVAYAVHRYAYRHMDIILPEGKEISEEEVRKYNMGAYALNVLHLPDSPVTKIDRDTTLAPTPEIFAYRQGIQAKLAIENPPIYKGLGTGSSGRQDDIGYRSGLKKYDTVVENSANAWATALGIGLKICETIPDWIPPNLKETDIGGYYQCTVELKATDPIETDRESTKGNRMQMEGIIDHYTNLTQFQGNTDEEAREIIARVLVDKATYSSPEIAQLLGMRYAQEHGMEEQLLALRQAQEMGQGRALEEKGGIGSQGGEPRVGNIKTAKGREESDLSLDESGARLSPSPFTP